MKYRKIEFLFLCSFSSFLLIGCSVPFKMPDGTLVQMEKRLYNYISAREKQGTYVIPDKVGESEVKNCKYWKNLYVEFIDSNHYLIKNISDESKEQGKNYINQRIEKSCKEADKYESIMLQEKMAKAARRDEEERARSREHANRKEEFERISKIRGAEEVSSGKCALDRIQKLESNLQIIKNTYELRAHKGHSFVLLNHEMLVASDNGIHVRFNGTVEGEIHLIAIGLNPLKMKVVDRTLNELLTKSDPEYTVNTILYLDSEYSDSRMFKSNAMSHYDVSIRGNGCVLIASFLYL